MDRVDGDDVGVLQLGQGLGLGPLGGGALQDHVAVGQVGLFGQEDAGEGPAPQLAAEQEVEDLVPRRGQRRDAVGLDDDGRGHRATLIL